MSGRRSLSTRTATKCSAIVACTLPSDSTSRSRSPQKRHYDACRYKSTGRLRALASEKAFSLHSSHCIACGVWLLGSAVQLPELRKQSDEIQSDAAARESGADPMSAERVASVSSAACSLTARS